MNKRIEMKQKTQVQLWVKVVSTIGILSIVGGAIFFILINLNSEKSYADDLTSAVETVSKQPILWVRADDNSANSDGSSISQWDDKTTKNNHLKQTSSTQQPKFFKNSDHVNSLGLLMFDGSNDNYKINNNTDINTSSMYDAKSIFVVFRSSVDIVSRQVIWEEGGNQCGLNIYIYDGFIYTGIYNKKVNPTWYFYTKEMVEEEKAYSLTITYDYANNYYASYLNGELVDSTYTAGKLSSHSGGIGVGNVNGQTKFHDDFVSKSSGYYFSGALTELIYFNDTLTELERVTVENQLTADYYLNSEASGLPISLLSFEGERVSEETHLSWSTASEQNNDYFSLERSSDGKNFTEIAQVPGTGNATTEKSYSYIDYESESGISYYRLSQTDFDGKSEVFPMITVGIEDKQEVLNILNTYPNPFTSELTIEYETQVSGLMEINIYDSRGVQVVAQQIDVYEGQSSYNVQGLEKLARGYYYCKIQVGDQQSASIKLIK